MSIWFALALFGGLILFIGLMGFLCDVLLSKDGCSMSQAGHTCKYCDEED